jgi:hypothetical protein
MENNIPKPVGCSKSSTNTFIAMSTYVQKNILNNLKFQGILHTEDESKQNHERMGSIKPQEKKRQGIRK